MRLAALCKYSLDVAEIRVDPATGELGLAGVPRRVGGIDRSVVEAAVRLREGVTGTVEVISLGPAVARDAFREVLAMGVDEVTLVEDPFDGGADAATAVTILASTIRARGPFDLVLCGFASDDGYSFQVGPRLSERLRLPLVAYARSIAVADGSLVVERDLEDRVQTVALDPPAIVSIAEEAFTPRRTTLMDALKARQKPVNVWDIDALGLGLDTLAAGRCVLSGEDVGVRVERGRQRLAGGTPVELADGLIDALLEAGLLAEDRR
jgi:electron transfer flavoprotein beta subunit